MLFHTSSYVLRRPYFESGEGLLLQGEAALQTHSFRDADLGMAKGPKRTLELVNYRLESRPLTDPRPRSLGWDFNLTQNRARPSRFV